MANEGFFRYDKRVQVRAIFLNAQGYFQGILSRCEDRNLQNQRHAHGFYCQSRNVNYFKTKAFK